MKKAVPYDRPAWYALMRKFLKLADPRANRARAAYQIWRMFLRNPWFQALLKRQARRLTRRRTSRHHLAEDAQGEAMLVLSKRLRKRPDLGVERERIEKTFPGWIARIAERLCKQALRAIRAVGRLPPERFRAEAVDDGEQERSERRLDLRLAISQLKEPEQSIMRLLCSSEQPSLHEIARRLRISYDVAVAARDRAKQLLKKRLGG
jgi:RNA polymerase sigma factor (sigma-70 family)